MLYTRKGDTGNTGAFGCNQRFSKNSVLIEALGSFDELNSFLGICKTKTAGFESKISGKKLGEIIEAVQNNLFIIQANIAGADKKITQGKIDEIEKIIDLIEKELPPIKSFFLPGGTELAAYFDYARAVSRRAERRAVALSEEQKIDAEIFSYLNRLSSLFYALARFTNLKSGKKEIMPDYH